MVGGLTQYNLTLFTLMMWAKGKRKEKASKYLQGEKASHLKKEGFPGLTGW